MTKCYKILKKETKTIHGDTYFKLEGINLHVKVEFDIFINIDINKHFVTVKYNRKTKTYKVDKIFSKNGGQLNLRNNFSTL